MAAISWELTPDLGVCEESHEVICLRDLGLVWLLDESCLGDRCVLSFSAMFKGASLDARFLDGDATGDKVVSSLGSEFDAPINIRGDS
eukprot:CAMPEP_0184701854 /NCGR_PEP_ID=MMETSP0313-20130426/21910_1 /TAXON_ID=2792 /ORGANISM="Porphyridium aerugineum, Strain SAG 1380-2" /LENGTH=87 /DNA_ID=CAMNT_0027162097 /DNA_START=121 /DNA_END=380 /DNA_ORIENTATION=-